jgi:hypothetical protein
MFNAESCSMLNDVSICANGFALCLSVLLLFSLSKLTCVSQRPHACLHACFQFLAFYLCVGADAVHQHSCSLLQSIAFNSHVLTSNTFQSALSLPRQAKHAAGYVCFEFAA